MIRNTVLKAYNLHSAVPGAANRQTTRVFDDTVATDEAVRAPQHVGVFAAARGPTPEILIRLQEWEAQPGPSNKDDANTGTASPLKTYLKDRDAAHQEGLPKESIFGQDYPDRESDFYT